MYMYIIYTIIPSSSKKHPAKLMPSKFAPVVSLGLTMSCRSCALNPQHIKDSGDDDPKNIP